MILNFCRVIWLTETTLGTENARSSRDYKKWLLCLQKQCMAGDFLSIARSFALSDVVVVAVVVVVDSLTL